MKPRFSSQGKAAWTLVDVMVAVAVLALVLGIFLYQRPEAQKKARKISCENNLKQNSLAFKVWPGGCDDKWQTHVPMARGGSMEMVATGNVTQTFIVMSNELSTTKTMVCPADAGRIYATNFATLANSNISYFVGIDAADTNPQNILSGDGNFELGGVPVKPGFNAFRTNDVVTWSPNTRHIKSGNLALTDGSVESTTDAGLQAILLQSGFDTNRFAIP